MAWFLVQDLEEAEEKEGLWFPYALAQPLIAIGASIRSSVPFGGENVR